jgi:hypothetical protein
MDADESGMRSPIRDEREIKGETDKKLIAFLDKFTKSFV